MNIQGITVLTWDQYLNLLQRDLMDKTAEEHTVTTPYEDDLRKDDSLYYRNTVEVKAIRNPSENFKKMFLAQISENSIYSEHYLEDIVDACNLIKQYEDSDTQKGVLIDMGNMFVFGPYAPHNVIIRMLSPEYGALIVFTPAFFSVHFRNNEAASNKASKQEEGV